MGAPASEKPLSARSCITGIFCALLAPSAWAAESGAAESSTYDMVYGLIAILVGIGLSGLAYLFFRTTIERVFERFSYSRFGSHFPRHYHRDSISDRIYGYYMYNSDDRMEWLSPYLRELLRIDDHARRLVDMERALVEEDFRVLSRAVEKFYSGEIHEFFGLMRTTRGSRWLECIGVDRDGRLGPPGFTLWFRDVTEQIESQQQMKRENARLKLENDSWRSWWSTLPVPVWVRNSNLAITECNEAYEKLLGHELGNSRDMQELNPKTREVAELAVESGTAQSRDCHVVFGGDRVLYRITETPLEGRGGYLGFAIDIRGQEKAEDELKRHKSAQAQFLESSASAIAIYGPNMHLRSWNRAFVTLWKLDESWLDANPTYGDLLEHLRTKRRLPEQANFQVFKKQNLQLFTDLITTHEEYYYLPDGRVLRVLVIPHALGGLMFAYEDVTDRLALERSYNTLIAVQRATLDQLHEGIAVFAENGRLKLYNPEYANLWGLDAAFLDSEPHIADVVESCRSLLSRNQSNWEGLKENLITQSISRQKHEGRLTLTDGKALEWRNVPLPDGATLLAFYDVTAGMLVEESLRDKNKALEEADRVKTEFLANMSYELRSPLTSIMGFSEALAKHYFGELNPKQEEYVGAIHSSSRQLMGLINNILDLAGMEAGYVKLAPTRIPVSALLKEVQAMHQQRLSERGILFAIQCEGALPPMFGDETRIKQIMYNLLSNAIKFSDENKSITLGAERVHHKECGDSICLYVEDKGEGIPDEDLPHVFTRFWRGVSPRARQAGAGLGLAMVKRFTELHGGAVSIRSQLGKGTVVRCYFPLAAAPAQQESSQGVLIK
ncbi:PAS domain-containing protein [bacterium]|nr:PAS domain-containing protein [bacterium]